MFFHKALVSAEYLNEKNLPKLQVDVRKKNTNNFNIILIQIEDSELAIWNWIILTKRSFESAQSSLTVHVKLVQNVSVGPAVLAFRSFFTSEASVNNEKSMRLLFGLPNFRIYSSIQISCMNAFYDCTCNWKTT